MSVCEVTRRDQFAMAALPVAAEWFGYKPGNAGRMAGMAFDIADAMEAARKAAEQSKEGGEK